MYHINRLKAAILATPHSYINTQNIVLKLRDRMISSCGPLIHHTYCTIYYISKHYQVYFPKGSLYAKYYGWANDTAFNISGLFQSHQSKAT